MGKVEIRYPRVTDAKKFFDILNNPNFKFFNVCPPSVESEIKWIKSLPENRKKNFEYNYAITYDGKLVGACGIKIDQHHLFIGQVGYFVDEPYWGEGIAPKAVKLLEKIAFKKLGIRRIQIRILAKNKASCRVAEKLGYVQEGTLRKAMKHGKRYLDCFLYAKVK